MKLALSERDFYLEIMITWYPAQWPGIAINNPFRSYLLDRRFADSVEHRPSPVDLQHVSEICARIVSANPWERSSEDVCTRSSTDWSDDPSAPRPTRCRSLLAPQHPETCRPIGLGDRIVSAKHAILGLVVERPSYAWRIALEARRQFRFADLAGSYPHWALEKLKAEGLVRRVCEDRAPVGSLGAGGQAIYEAIEKGVRAFEDWLRSTLDDHSLRDDVQLRLALAHPEDVPRLVERIRDRELVCAARTLEHVCSGDPKVRSALHNALGEVARDAELTFWHGRAGWLRSVRETLEGISVDVRVWQ